MVSYHMLEDVESIFNDVFLPLLEIYLCRQQAPQG